MFTGGKHHGKGFRAVFVNDTRDIKELPVKSQNMDSVLISKMGCTLNQLEEKLFSSLFEYCKIDAITACHRFHLGLLLMF